MTDDANIRIVRAKHGADTPYFMHRRETAQDSRLSFEARGVLAYLLSKPDDWTVDRDDLMREGGTGRDKMNKIIGELKKHGYLKRERLRDELGKWTGSAYIVYEDPDRTTENPSDGETVGRLDRRTENPQHTYKRDIQNTEPSTQHPLNPPQPEPSAGEDPVPPEGEDGNATDENAIFRYIQGRCVEVVFSGNDKQFGNAGKIANWALCRSMDPTWQRLHPAHPMDDIEFDAFLLWFGDKRLSWPRRPDAWNQQVHEFRREHDKSRYMVQARRNRQPEQESTPSPDELLMARALASEANHVQ
jgi:hypothetical protein